MLESWSDSLAFVYQLPGSGVLGFGPLASGFINLKVYIVHFAYIFFTPLCPVTSGAEMAEFLSLKSSEHWTGCPVVVFLATFIYYF